ncbi:MAG: hypothetical protein HY881_17155 [Deltaproteobacteria bacterium]|nr:hypothetical protein [Deltaproteobacteria bacterium]
MARYRLIIFVLSLMVALGGYSLHAAGPPDFSGTWTLDLNAPEATSMEAILKAQGAPWIKRKAMDTMPMTQVITQTEKTLTIKVDTGLGARTQVLHLDGSAQIQDSDEKGKVEYRSFWDKDGTSLVTVTKSASPNGKKPGSQIAEYATRRYLQDQGRTLIVEHVLTFDDGRKLTGKRVLRKK